MTKKRFAIIGDNNVEFLMQSKLLLPIYDNKERLSLKSCCDVLNALHEENQKLLTLSNMKKGALVEAVKELIEENEQLKGEFKQTGMKLNKIMRLLVSKEYAQMFIELQDVLYELSEKELIE